MEALQIITEPRRREILRLVWDGERSVTDLAEHFDLTMGAVSQHLAILRDAGYVTVTRDGNRRLYRADQQSLARYRDLLQALWASALDGLVEAIEADVRADPGSRGGPGDDGPAPRRIGRRA